MDDCNVRSYYTLFDVIVQWLSRKANSIMTSASQSRRYYY